MVLPGISITEADGQIFLRGQANGDRAPMDANTIHALLKESGYENCAIDGVAIATAAEYCNTRKEPFLVQLGDRKNARVDVTISADDMSAEVTLARAQGGKEVSFDDIIELLKAAGVLFGIDEAALLAAYQSESSCPIPIAHGTIQQDGIDSVFEELIPHPADRAPRLDENGLIDYREHGSIDVVTAGTVLMRRHPATPGLEGHTVRGRPLPARPGRDEPFAPQLPGTQHPENDPNLLEAAVTGQPVRVDNGVMVEQVLQVAEVNMATGNIHFDGSVEVKGDVLQGMKVEASGDIVVSGMVDGGILQAGGDIRIAGGVIANARVRATGAVSARFAQGVQIHAGTVLALSDMALECDLLSLNKIVIGIKNPGHGRLVGGSATAMMLVSVPVLGSANGAVTTVVVGTNAELSARYADLQRRIQLEKANEEALEKLMKQVTAMKDPKGMLPRIKASRQHAMQVWGQSLAEKKEMEQKIAVGLTAKVSIGAAVEGAVDFVFSSHSVRLRREFSSGTFSLDPVDHVVVFTDGFGKTTTIG